MITKKTEEESPSLALADNSELLSIQSFILKMISFSILFLSSFSFSQKICVFISFRGCSHGLPQEQMRLFEALPSANNECYIFVCSMDLWRTH